MTTPVIPTNRIQVEWIVETDKVLVWSVPSTVLQLEPIRDVELCYFHVQFFNPDGSPMVKPDNPDVAIWQGPEPFEAEVVLAQQLAARGQRLLKVQRLGGPMRVRARQQVGDTSYSVEDTVYYNQLNPHRDFHYWCAIIGDDRTRVPKDHAVGWVIRTNVPCLAKIKVGGV